MKKYGLIGKTLKHSFSKKYFTHKFEKENNSSIYELFEIETIEDFLTLREIPNLSGLNVTLPYKEKIIPYLDEIDETAQTIGAVNTIQFIRETNKKPTLKGYNTDVLGFTTSIQPKLKPWHKKALILGTGGAAKAIAYGLTTLGIEIQYVSRNPMGNQIGYNDINSSILNEFYLIVNTTPVGMYPRVEECPNLPYSLLKKEHLLFDAIYNPKKTLFLQKGEKQGSEIWNGMEMLINQAEESWKIWNK